MNAYARLTALENAIKSRILLYSEQLFADMTEDSMFLNELYYCWGKERNSFRNWAALILQQVRSRRNRNEKDSETESRFV